ncbi:cyclic nucleotide-binding domain-containing protein [Candidatus Gracilibacteria bacterium]|nr:cyclic nucleotide-binding domain-containing protein [Candidatus Gracilibacteria bacterium]
MDISGMLPIIKQIPLFEALNEAQHEEIIKNITMNYYPVGHVFFQEGQTIDENACMYILKNGMVRISRKQPIGDDKEVAVLSNGGFFGEMAFVFEEPRNATATALGECEVFELKKQVFMKLMENAPETAAKISQEFIDRVKQNNQAS